MAEGRVKMVESLIAMPSTQVFLSTVMNRDEPLVLRRAVSDWECASWNPEFLARELGDLETQFKFALRESNGKNVQLMETECEFATGTLSNFCSWLRGEREQAQQLARFDRYEPRTLKEHSSNTRRPSSKHAIFFVVRESLT